MKNRSGFSLMELMVVIAIIGILSAVSIPNIISWRSNHQLNSSARELKAFINGARIDAVKNNAIVTITINAGTRKITSQYTNRASGVSPPPKELLIRPQVEITGNNFPDGGFRFNSRGLPIHLKDGAFAAGTITLANSRGRSFDVIMASTGTTRIQ